jgi:hypothetical protein
MTNDQASMTNKEGVGTRDDGTTLRKHPCGSTPLVIGVWSLVIPLRRVVLAMPAPPV